MSVFWRYFQKLKILLYIAYCFSTGLFTITLPDSRFSSRPFTLINDLVGGMELLGTLILISGGVILAGMLLKNSKVLTLGFILGTGWHFMAAMAFIVAFYTHRETSPLLIIVYIFVGLNSALLGAISARYIETLTSDESKRT